MSEAAPLDFERMLRQALVPVEPPDDLQARLDSTLQGLADIAFDELEAWELGAMRDPRNWPTIPRSVAAVAVGAGAGTALVVLRVRAQRNKHRAASRSKADLAQRTLHAAASETRRLLRRG